MVKRFLTEWFKTAYLARLREFNKTIFQPERIHQQVDELAAVIRGPIQDESKDRLVEFEKAVAGQKVTIAMGPGFGSGTSVSPIKPFVKARVVAVADQLEGKSEGKRLIRGLAGDDLAKVWVGAKYQRREKLEKPALTLPG